MAIIPTEPGPGRSPGPDLPPIGELTPPIKEPEPDRLSDEEPNPNPDENDKPAMQTGAYQKRTVPFARAGWLAVCAGLKTRPQAEVILKNSEN